MIEKKKYDEFDWQLYVATYPEELHYINDKDEAWKHWKEIGENKKYSLDGGYVDRDFDWDFYVNIYSDLNHITSAKEAWKHYLLIGKKEERLINIEQLKF